MRAATISCDVLVVGGGAAGVAAAVAAGRAGAQVVLLERYGFLGGLATAAQVGTICGLYLRDAAHAEAMPVAGGFVKEYAERLERAAGASRIRLHNGLWVLPYPPPAFASVADALVGAPARWWIAAARRRPPPWLAPASKMAPGIRRLPWFS